MAEDNLLHELVGATGLSVKAGESETQFARRLAKAFNADDFSDEKWEEMSETAQELANEIMKAKGNNYPDLPGWEDLASEIAEKSAKKEKVVVEKKPRPPSALARAKALWIQDPKMSVERVLEALQGEDLKATPVTLNTVRADFFATCRVLRDQGKLVNFDF
jgi:hypothetical protein